MEQDLTTPGKESDLTKATQTLNSILGTADITPEELLAGFSSDQKLKEISKPGLTLEEIKVSLTSEEEGSTKTAVPELTNMKVMSNAVKAFWRWAKKGFSQAPPEVMQRRLAACNACEHFIDPPGRMIYNAGSVFADLDKVCALCGCYTKKKVKLISENCPKEDVNNQGFSKWGEPMSV